jgi:BMFP domain-containing protein YqiC
MRENQTLIDDMVTLGGNLLGNLMGTRHEFRAQAKERFGSIARQLDLVSRSEFDAAFAMLAKARAMQEDFSERLAAIESHLKLSSGKNTVKTVKLNLPSVKKDQRRKARK